VPPKFSRAWEPTCYGIIILNTKAKAIHSLAFVWSHVFTAKEADWPTNFGRCYSS
jgi:hypothetical protein